MLNSEQTTLTDTLDPRVASSKSQLKMEYRNSQVASLTTEQSQPNSTIYSNEPADRGITECRSADFKNVSFSSAKKY